MERKDLLDVLVSKHLTLSAMESLTGGLFCEAFTSVPGASAVFKGGAVTYTDAIKEAFGVSEETIAASGAVSLACAKEMALCAAKFFDTDVAVSFTGNAGPDESEGKPVGMVFIAMRIQNTLYSYALTLKGSRDDIRHQAVDFAFQTLYSKLTAGMVQKS
jgi:PncC family amidohydrolase